MRGKDKAYTKVPMLLFCCRFFSWFFFLVFHHLRFFIEKIERQFPEDSFLRTISEDISPLDEEAESGFAEWHDSYDLMTPGNIS